MKTVAYISDIHLDEQYPADIGADPRSNWQLILADINSKGISEIIFGGDIGASSSYKYFFNSLNGFSKNLKITLGNHDSYKEIKKYYKNDIDQRKDELYYSLEDDSYEYFFLDSSSSKISSNQLEWLEKRLHFSSKKPVIFIHHPVLKVDTFLDTEYPLNNREAVKKLFLKQKQDIIIFCGHYHMDDKSEFNNIIQFITPAGSYQAVKEADNLELNTNLFGYRIINFGKGEINSDTVWFKKNK